jgi:dihydrofolate reductase
MAKLIYSVITSLDGYVADQDGNFDWAAPDEEVHAFVNDRERQVGTYLYGRRMYDVMVYWETAHTQRDLPPVEQDYASIWRAADKIVYSRTLQAASSARTRIEHDFDAEAVRQLKGTAQRDISVAGPGLAAQAIQAGLVDECHLFLNPVVVGGGNPALPDDVRLDLELLDEHRIGNGVVHLHYRIRARPGVWRTGFREHRERILAVRPEGWHRGKRDRSMRRSSPSPRRAPPAASCDKSPQGAGDNGVHHVDEHSSASQNMAERRSAGTHQIRGHQAGGVVVAGCDEILLDLGVQGDVGAAKPVHPDQHRRVVCAGVVDPNAGECAEYQGARGQADGQHAEGRPEPGRLGNER